MDSAGRSLLLTVLGVLLLCNGLYLYPGGVSYEQEYEVVAEPVDSTNWPTGEFGITRIRDCAGGVDSEECALIRHLVEQGEIRVEQPGDVYAAVTNESEQLPEFFYVDEQYYQRTATLEGGTLVVSMDPIDRQRVLRTAAENATAVRDAYRQATENGTVWTTERLHRSELLVASDDEIYHVLVRGPFRGEVIGWDWFVPDAETLWGLRVFSWLGGLGLLWYAGYHYADQS